VNALYKPLSPEWQEDPYPFYARLREEAPVYWSEEFECWVVARYDDVDAVVSNYTAFSNALGPIAGEEISYKGRPRYSAMFTADPPDHSRLRGPLHQAFTRKSIGELESRTRRVVNELIDAVQPTGLVDLVLDFGEPLSAAGFADMVEVPASMWATLSRWSEVFVILESRLGGPAERDDLRKADDYFRALLEERRRKPSADLATTLVRAVGEGRLTEWEAIDTCFVLVAGAMETTKRLVGNTMFALIHNPDEYRKVREDRSLIPSMIEEGLRYDNSTQTLMRTATRDVELRGQTIRKGQVVHAIIGSANRDGDHFPDPDRFDVTRHSSDHLAFGKSIHMCLGLHLARLQLRVGFNTLLDRLPGLRLEPEAKPRRSRSSFIIRGYDSFPMRFDVA
jgi:cytochrome P450